MSITPVLVQPDVVVFHGNHAADSLYLRVAADTLELEFSEDGVGYSNDLSSSASGLQSLVISSNTQIEVDLQGDNDSLMIDVSLNDALTGSGGTLALVGGAGSDTLVGPDGVTTWHVTGPDAGTLNGRIRFDGVERLQGAAQNEDTFILAPGGSVSGTVDGGPGGFDSLVVQGGTYTTVTFAAAGPDSGRVELDGTPVFYAGLEPLVSDADAANVVIQGTALDDRLVLEADPDESGKMRVRSLNGTMESVSFNNPATSLTVHSGGGDDTITLNGLDPPLARR